MPRMESAVRKNPSRRQPGYAQCRAPQPACTNHSRHSQVPSCCCQSHLPHFQLLQIRLYFLLPVMTSSFSVGHYRSVIVAVRHGRHLSAGFGAGAPRPLSAASRTPAISAYSALREADAQGLKEVVVMQPIGIGIAVAIRDRLARAANGR